MGEFVYELRTADGVLPYSRDDRRKDLGLGCVYTLYSSSFTIKGAEWRNTDSTHVECIGTRAKLGRDEVAGNLVQMDSVIEFMIPDSLRGPRLAERGIVRGDSLFTGQPLFETESRIYVLKRGAIR